MLTLLQPLGVDGERGDADLVLAGVDAGMIASNGADSYSAFRPSFCGDRVEQVDVEADDRLAVGVEELRSGRTSSRCRP